MKNKLGFAYAMAGVLVGAFIFGSSVIFAAPSVNILGNYAVVGTGLFATTSANANLTASGTIAFPSLYTLNQPFVIIGSDGTLNTTSSPATDSFTTTTINGVQSVSFTFATGTATGIGLTISTSSDTITFTPTVTSGYSIPLTASTTNWESFYQTPSTRITAGTGLSWSTNTLNSDVVNNWTLSGSNLYASSTSWNVGVGTSSPNPSARFNIVQGGDYNAGVVAAIIENGGASNRATVRLRTTNDNPSEFAYDVNSALRWMWSTRGSSEGYKLNLYNQGGSPSYTSVSGPVLSILQDGNVGIGTSTPARRLTVAGSVEVSAGDIIFSTNNRYLFLSGSGVLNIGDAGDDINIAGGGIYAKANAGNVGIGTSTPSVELEVVGDSRISGSLLVAGSSVYGKGVYGATYLNTTTTNKDVGQALRDYDVTLYRFECDTAGGGDVTVGADERASSTPTTHGTDVFSAPITCTGTGTSTESFANAGITAYNKLMFYATSSLGNSTSTVNWKFYFTND